MMVPMCGKCMKITAALFLALGLVYLLTDLGVVTFWKVNWYTSLFLLVGVGTFASSICKDCQAIQKK